MRTEMPISSPLRPMPTVETVEDFANTPAMLHPRLVIAQNPKRPGGALFVATYDGDPENWVVLCEVVSMANVGEFMDDYYRGRFGTVIPAEQWPFSWPQDTDAWRACVPYDVRKPFTYGLNGLRNGMTRAAMECVFWHARAIVSDWWFDGAFGA